MQNNTIAFTILKFPVLVRVQRNFTTVYSIFSFSTQSQTRSWYSYTFNFFSLAFPTSMFQSTIFLKGTFFALLVSCQIQTLASPWSNSIVPKIGVLFTGSLFCLPRSLEYITRCHIRWRYRQRTQCVSRVIYAHNRNHFQWRNPCEPSGQCWGRRSVVPTREEAGSIGTGGSHLGWVRFDLLCITATFHVADIGWINCCWVLEVGRGVSIGCQGVPFPCSTGLCETVDPLVCPVVLRKEKIKMIISYKLCTGK